MIPCFLPIATLLVICGISVAVPVGLWEEAVHLTYLLNGLGSSFNSISHSATELLEMKWDWPWLSDCKERIRRARGMCQGYYGFMQMTCIQIHTYCRTRDHLLVI